MAIRGVAFVGLRTDRFGATVSLFRDIIGATVIREESGAVGFALGDTRFELYGPDDDFHRFFTTGPVVGFRVDDFDTTREAMIGAGIAFIGEPQHEDGVSW